MYCFATIFFFFSKQVVSSREIPNGFTEVVPLFNGELSVLEGKVNVGRTYLNKPNFFASTINLVLV
jgi:hypothetical protein